MAGIPQNFQAISNVLSNYNFVDIASGTGYINFYCGDTVDKSLLSNFSYYANTIVTSHAAGSAAYTLQIDIDYDTVMNRPLDLRGLGIVNVPIYLINTDAGGGKNITTYVTAILRKWDGSTETDIVSNDSSVVTSTSTFGAYTMLSIDLDVPLTHFKVGETLRLTIDVYSRYNVGATTGTVSIAHDPKNRTTGWDTSGAVPSQLLFQCPVRLNL